MKGAEVGRDERDAGSLGHCGIKAPHVVHAEDPASDAGLIRSQNQLKAQVAHADQSRRGVWQQAQIFDSVNEIDFNIDRSVPVEEHGAAAAGRVLHDALYLRRPVGRRPGRARRTIATAWEWSSSYRLKSNSFAHRRPPCEPR